MKGKNSSNNSCTANGGGCCQSIIICPVGFDCNINCSFSCQHLIVHAENSSSLFINDCTDNSCNNMTIHCPTNSSSQCIINNIESTVLSSINITKTIIINNENEDKPQTVFEYLTDTKSLFFGIVSGLITFVICSCIFCILPYFCLKLKKLRELETKQSNEKENKCKKNDEAAITNNDRINNIKLTLHPPSALRLHSNDSIDATTTCTTTLGSVCGSIQLQTSGETNMSSEQSSTSPFGDATTINTMDTADSNTTTNMITITRINTMNSIKPESMSPNLQPISSPNLSPDLSPILSPNLSPNMKPILSPSLNSVLLTVSNVSDINSMLSLSQNNTEYYRECNRNSMKTSECMIVHRMIDIMSKFEQINIEKQNGTMTSDEICNLILKQKYQHTTPRFNSEFNIYYLWIKNDYNHVLESHDDNHSFHYIYTSICNHKQLCDVNQCDHVLRAINHKYHEKKDVLILSLFDTMHCYFMHSYDTGMRVQILFMNKQDNDDDDDDNDDDPNSNVNLNGVLSLNDMYWSPTQTYTNNTKNTVNYSMIQFESQTISNNNIIFCENDNESLKLHIPESRKYISSDHEAPTDIDVDIVYEDTDVTKLKISIDELKTDNSADIDSAHIQYINILDAIREKEEMSLTQSKLSNLDLEDIDNIIERKILSRKQPRNIQQIINRQNRYISEVIDHEKRISRSTTKEIEGLQSRRGIQTIQTTQIQTNYSNHSNHTNHTNQTPITDDNHCIDFIPHIIDEVPHIIDDRMGKMKKLNLYDTDSGVTLDTMDTMPTIYSLDYDYDDLMDDELINDGVYSFGIRWYYWTKYKLHKYYVLRKYDNLKIELLESSHLKLSDWDSIYEKSIAHLNSYKGRHLICNDSPLINDYDEIIKGSTMSLYHMISLVIYCNFDKLQYEMKKTFRVIRAGETLKSIKLRNERYANWSRYLREAIELYGILMRDSIDIKFYHGIIGELVFPTTICQFCPPTSFTTSLSVATSFSGGSSGIILSLEIYGLDVSYFDCRWISDYSNEQERVVCGGYQSFLMRNIMLIRLEHDYKQYLKAINIILSLIHTKFNPEKNINKKTIKIIQAIINYCIISRKPNPFEIPQYVLKLFDCIRMNWTQEIKISLPQLRDKKFYKPLKKIFIHQNGDDEKWINLDIISKIFIHCPKITICGNYGNDGIFLSNKTFEKLLDFLKNVINKSQFIELNQIIFESPNESILNGKNAEIKYREKFEELNYRLNYEDTNKEGISSIFITKTDVIIEHETIQ